jgi:hypothetical protein
MFVGAVLFLAATVSSSVLPAAAAKDRWPDVSIVVFRHHPGLLETEARMAARKRDHETIFKALQAARIGFRCAGGLGSGYELSLRARDLGRWKALIDHLHKSKALDYYSNWGLDAHGYGLVPVR